MPLPPTSLSPPPRALRTQRFLHFTQVDIAQRNHKQQEVWDRIELARKGKVATRAELDAFYFRLQVMMGGVEGWCTGVACGVVGGYKQQ